jgi:hypothetical protein
MEVEVTVLLDISAVPALAVVKTVIVPGPARGTTMCLVVVVGVVLVLIKDVLPPLAFVVRP